MKTGLFSGGNLMDLAKYAYTIPYALRKLYKQPRTFSFLGKSHTYFEHPYNATWDNERALEIPIVWDYVQKHAPAQVLEVGNVLAHYFPISHTVVDKYEPRPGVISEDVVSVQFDRKFSCIVSISTVEHIGWDEFPRQPGKHLQALDNLKSLLKPDGEMVITIPLASNPHLDADLFGGKLGCTQIYYFKRLSHEAWREADQETVRNSQFGKKYRSADGLAICYWKV